MKLETNGRWLSTWTGAGVTATPAFLIAAHGSMDLVDAHTNDLADAHGAMGHDQKSFKLVWR